MTFGERLVLAVLCALVVIGVLGGLVRLAFLYPDAVVTVMGCVLVALVTGVFLCLVGAFYQWLTDISEEKP